MASDRRVALVCIDPWTAGHDLRPFNYGVRKIQAALLAAPGLDAEVHLVESTSRDPDEITERIEAIDPDVVGASAYVWSLPTFFESARRLKRSRPDRTIVFGGPSARVEMLALPPYQGAHESIDALVLGEGELVFREIIGLLQRDRDALGRVDGVAVATSDGYRTVGAAPRVPVLDEMASPYQMGLVPAGVQAHLETFRGCPLSCSFCQWGDLEQSTRVHSKEYLVRELEAYRRAGLGGAILVDAALNLNPKAFRNLVAAEREVGFLRDTALDFEVYPSHMTDEHARFLEEVRVGRVGVGLQSYDKEVLRRLQRPFDPARFERVVRDLARVAPVTIEIILGLPGDTRDSFRRTFERARALPAEVRVFHCLALPDALMTRLPPGLTMDFDPVSLMLRSATGWPAEELRAESERLTREMEEAGGWQYETAWTFPGPRFVRREPAPRREPAKAAEPEDTRVPLAPPVRAALHAALQEITLGAWKLDEATRGPEGVTAIVTTPDGQLTLDLRPAAGGARAYRVVDGVAYSYRPSGAPPSARTLRALDAISTRLRRLVGRIVLGAAPDRASLPTTGAS